MENDKLVRLSDVLAAATTPEKCDGYNLYPPSHGELLERINNIPAVDAVEVPETGIGDMSDGYHTFNELYHQRAVLFAALVKAHKDRAWKSWRHSDGELPFGKENYFIVGIDTPEGSYTYHYHGEYWDMFDRQELPLGKEWDGHTDKDVTRLLSLPVDATEVRHGRWEGDYPQATFRLKRCSICETLAPEGWYCFFCGARMDGRREDGEV